MNVLRLTGSLDQCDVVVVCVGLQSFQRCFADSASRRVDHTVERDAVSPVVDQFQVSEYVFDFLAVVESCSTNDDIRYVVAHENFFYGATLRVRSI